MSPGRRAVLLNAALWLGMLGMLALIAERYPLHWDLTASQRNSLSTASQTVLAAINGPISATVYLAPDAELHRQIKARLAPYQRAKADFSVRFVDPATDPQTVRELGISAGGELVLEYQQRREQLQTIAEFSISQALQRLGDAGRAPLRVLQGHGERSLDDASDAGIQRWAEALAATGLPLRGLDLTATTEIPANTAALLILAPRSALLPGEIQIVLDYLASGGNLLWLLDPDSAPISPLADELGLLPLAGTVVMQDYELLGLSHPALALVARYPDHPLSRGLDQISVFALATALLPSNDGWQRSPLLQTSDRSWLESGPLQGQIAFDAANETRGPLLLGVAQSRPAQQQDEQRVVVIGDSDFLSNAYLDQLGNRRLAMNLAQWLSRRDRQLDIDIAAAPDIRLQLTPATTRLIAIGYVLILPLLFALTGGLLWWRRGRRR